MPGCRGLPRGKLRKAPQSQAAPDPGELGRKREPRVSRPKRDCKKGGVGAMEISSKARSRRCAPGPCDPRDVSPALAMIFKLAEAAEKSWRHLDGYNQLPKVILGVKFTDGIEVVRSQAQTAAA